ncbi:MAG: PEP-CTERM sorting domain-containing protein, partial [Flavobacteriales bacterium]
MSMLAVAGCVMSGAAQADMLYTVIDDGSNSKFAAINPTTLALTVIGNTGVGGAFGDLAYDATSGTMYWAAGRNNNQLYTINMSTGTATLVGNHGVNDLFALGWNGSGLYGLDSSGQFYSLNTSTGAATNLGQNNIYAGGLDLNTTTGQMISITAGSGTFHSVNTGNGAATQLATGSWVNDGDVAYDAGRNAYWVIDYSQNLFRYDANTYARTTLSDAMPYGTASLEHVGAVPEPETYALLMAGLGLMGTIARRRRMK